MMVIRPAVDGDAVLLAPLFLESSGGTWAAVLRARSASRQPVEALAIAAFQDRFQTLSIANTVVAEEGGQLLGGLCAFQETAAAPLENSDSPLPVSLSRALQPFRELVDAQSLFIAELACRRSARGRGVGRRLLESALADAASRQLPRVSLRVFSENVGAVRLYERLGFTVTDSRALVPHPAILAQGSVLQMVCELEEVPERGPSGGTT